MSNCCEVLPSRYKSVLYQRLSLVQGAPEWTDLFLKEEIQTRGQWLYRLASYGIDLMFWISPHIKPKEPWHLCAFSLQQPWRHLRLWWPPNGLNSLNALKVKFGLRFEISNLNYHYTHMHIGSNGHLDGIWGCGDLQMTPMVMPDLKLASITYVTMLLWPLNTS